MIPVPPRPEIAYGTRGFLLFVDTFRRLAGFERPMSAAAPSAGPRPASEDAGPAPRPDLTPDLTPGLAGAAWLLVAVVATLPLFRFGLAGLAEAWSRPEFSHGPVIPVPPSTCSCAR
jgi:hypothetical protein